jgi:glycosyltransferase involved in cell wall biosynthesis
MNKKKILHVTYDMRIGGTEMVIKNIIESCDNEQFEMSIFCIDQPLGPWGVGMLDGGVSIDSMSRKDGFDLSVITALRKHINVNAIDIIHCHQYTPWVYGALAAFGLHAKVIFTEHGRFYPDSSGWKRRIVNPILALITHGITAISQATKNALVEYEFLPEKRINVIYNGIKALPNLATKSEVRCKYKIDQETVLLGTIARLDPIKNHPMMLRGLKLCLDMKLNVKLMIVGDGETRQAIEELIINLDLTNHVILTGYEPQPAELLEAFDIYLLTSFSEGTSMTLLEAMSLSKPCIVTNVGGNPEVIQNELNGLVVESDDNDGLASAIMRLTQSSLDIVSMGEQAKKRYLKLFSAKTMLSQYAKLYTRLS